jgi:hypothetical protein
LKLCQSPKHYTIDYYKIIHKNVLLTIIIFSLTASLAIKRLKVQCNNSLDTAGQELGQHEANCDENAVIPCPNLCLIPSAPEVGEARYTTKTMPRKDLKNHLPECPRRKAICGYCGTSGVYQWVANRHMLECTKLEVVCPNDGCEERIIHLHLPEHRQTCMYESIPCRYETLGCTHATPRMDGDERQQHENNFEVHAGLMVESLLTKQQEQQAYFKINDFSYYKSLDKTFKYSADMWNWYILIQINGRGEGKGTHISASLYWKQALRNMPSWLNSIKIELLNHRENKNHFSYTFTDPDGLVNEKFIPHTALAYKPSYNVLYLKDETLCFRVTSAVINCKQLKPNTTW